MDDERRVKIKAKALKEGFAKLRELCSDGDAELFADMIEGEMDLEGFVTRMCEQINEDKGFAVAIGDDIDAKHKRKKRLENRADRYRVLLASVLDEALVLEPKKTFSVPLFTVTVAKLKPGVIIRDETEIPAKYWERRTPKLARAKLRSDALARQDMLLEAQEIENADERRARLAEIDSECPPIPGIELDNGDISLTIRRG